MYWMYIIACYSSIRGFYYKCPLSLKASITDKMIAIYPSLSIKIISGNIFYLSDHDFLFP
ncbi:hypothetical protein F975_02497 [Acinetobacter sp. ANC 3789]|nr:hypothetical protein F975_02497 [Acinetobacter sp. ANC 3789]